MLAAAVAAAVSMPLLAQVKSAQTASQPQQAQRQPSANPLGALPATPPAATQPAVDPNKVIASAGTLTVTAGEYNAAVATLPPQAAPLLVQPAMRKRIAQQIIQIKQLAAEAKRRQVDQRPEVKRQLEMQEDQILANALAKELQTDSSDQADRTYFDANKSSFDDVKARHILIRTPDSPVPLDQGKTELTDAQAKSKAEQIKSQIDKGGDFAAIAKAESDDKGSGVKGGDLGTFAPWKMEPTFAKAALALQKNQVSTPVKTPFGYHIIQLLDDAPRTYDQAKGEIPQARWSALLAKLNADSKTEYDSSFFGGGAAAPASGAATSGAAIPAAAQAQAKKGA